MTRPLLPLFALGLLGAVALPVALQHGVSLLALGLTLLWSWAALSLPRVRAYGLTSASLPGALGLLLTPGPLEARALGAGLTVLTFVAGTTLVWGLEEEIRAPWLGALALLVWQPSSLGLLGLGGLALLSSLRWRGGVSWTRGAVKNRSTPAWVAALGLIALLALVTVPLPAPAALRVPRVPTPRFVVVQPPLSTVSPPRSLTPLESASGRGLGRLGLPSAWWWLGLAVLIGLVWRSRRTLLPRTGGQPGTLSLKARGGGRAFVPLLLLTVALLWVALYSWRGATTAIPVPVELFTSGWQILFGIGAVAALWAVWRWLRGFQRFRLSATSPAAEVELRHANLELHGDRVRAAYQTWLSLVHDLELRRAAWQTPVEYARFVTVHHPELRSSTDALTGAYERVRYGGVPSERELEAALEALQTWQRHAARLALELEREATQLR